MTGRDRFRFTTFRWANQLTDQGKYAKRPLMRKGFAYADFTCGTDTPHKWRTFNPEEQTLQIGLICSPQTFLLAVDVDHPVEYTDDKGETHPGFDSTATAGLVGRDDAMSTRGDGFHVGLDMRGIPPARWPRQGRIAGADIKAAGFVPWPGSVHYSGEPYAWHRWTADGLPALVPVTEDILAALGADRGAFYAEPRPGGSGGHAGGMDHDTAQAGVCLSLVMHSLTDEQIRAEWDKTAAHDWPDCDEDGAMGDAEFNRHLLSARRKEARMAADQAAWLARCLRRAAT